MQTRFNTPGTSARVSTYMPRAKTLLAHDPRGTSHEGADPRNSMRIFASY